MIRVVLDTNVIVSAVLQPLGLPAQVFLRAIGGSIQLCISGDVYAEYEEILRRPRLRRDENVIAATLHSIRESGLWVRPMQVVRACVDPDDDMFVECAQAASAHYVVTGNIKDFPDSWHDIRIVTPRRFLEIMSGETEPTRHV